MFNTLKVGDKVGTCKIGRQSAMYTIRTISRLTPTQMVLDNDTKYRLKDGSFVGEADYPPRLVTAQEAQEGIDSRIKEEAYHTTVQCLVNMVNTVRESHTNGWGRVCSPVTQVEKDKIIALVNAL